MEFLSTILNIFKDFDGLTIVLLVYLILEMRHIRKDLSNHITDTNKKIEKLSDRLERLREYFDSRFDRLYEVLLKDKKTD